MPSIAGIVSDLDGVVFRGDTPIDSAIDALNAFRERGVRIAFVTNNSTKHPGEVATKLAGMGLAIDANRIVTSTQAAVVLLLQRFPDGCSAFVVGSPALQAAVREAGFSEAEERADAVVAGLDRAFDYAKLKRAARLIHGGALLVGTNADPVLPVEGGLDPGSGSILSAIATAGGVAPIVAGKPERPLVDEALKRLGLPRKGVVMIGDQIATDILAGQRAGLFSILVKTGAAQRGEPAAVPDRIVDTLAELL